MIHSTPFPIWPVLLFLSITLISPRVPTCVCMDNPQFLNCTSTIQCGDLQNIGYPFWGSNRASYCGLGDGFQLTCEENIALLTIDNLKYRLVSYGNSTNNFTVARDDYWGTLCPSTFQNTSQDFSPFAYTWNTVADNLTLYYGCQATNVPATIPLINRFSCTVNDSDVIVGYYFARNVGNIPAFAVVDRTTVLNYFAECETSVVVPAYVSAIQAIESNPLNSTVEAALKQGFGLQWTDATQSVCADCAATGGQCGRDETLGDFACYCSGETTSSICSGIVLEMQATASCFLT